jgi:pimeloyl-ACP methyl ester carboxylesterase
MTITLYPLLPLPVGNTERYIETDNLTFHLREAGYDPSKKKLLVLLLHGFPELVFSWRKVMLSIATDEYHVVAYGQRGYGRTTGWDTRPFSETDLRSFSYSSLVTDSVRLVSALGYKRVECIIGHDFRSLVASLCAMAGGDIFKR